MRQYLVVANHTLGGPELLDAIRDRMARGPAEFWVLVPATPTTHLVNDFNALSCAFPVDPDVLPSAADDRTPRAGHRRGAGQGSTPRCSGFARSAPRPRARWATADPMKAIETTPGRTAVRRDHPVHAAAGHLPLAGLGPAPSHPAPNRHPLDRRRQPGRYDREPASAEPTTRTLSRQRSPNRAAQAQYGQPAPVDGDGRIRSSPRTGRSRRGVPGWRRRCFRCPRTLGARLTPRC